MQQRLKILRANLIAMALIALGIVVLLNFLSARHHKRFDITATGQHTLAGQTVKLLQSLDSPLKITLFDKAGSAERVKAERLLDAYRYYSEQIQTTSIDPDQNPALAKQYGIERYGTLFFEYKKRQEQTEKISEAAFTNVILNLTRNQQKKVYFLAGHGENNLEAKTKTGYSSLKEAIGKQNYGVEKLLLMRAAKVPEDCSVLIVSGPEKALLPEELTSLEEYLQKGGNALFMLDPPPGIGLENLLAQWGIKVGDDMIIDKVSRLFGGDYFMPVVTTYAQHPITRDFNLASFFPVARSISPQENLPPSLMVQPLALTTQGSWAEADYKAQHYEFNQGRDQAGPISLAVTAEIVPEEPSSQEEMPPHQHQHSKEKENTGKPATRLVVIGDADFANNTYLNLSGNRDFLLNILSWLAQEEDLISIRPKEKIRQTINLTQSQMQGVFYITVGLLPLLVLGIGLLVWFRRRRA